METHDDSADREAVSLSIKDHLYDQLGDEVRKLSSTRQADLMEHLKGDDVMDLSQRLKQAIEGSGMSLYAICKEAEINLSVLYRFMEGERDLRLDTAGKIADVLGLQLQKPAQRKKRKTKV